MKIFTNACLGFALFSTIAAFAQDSHTLETPTPEPQLEHIDRVEVTGSHIKRVDVEGVAPVDIVTKKDLEKKDTIV